MANLNKLALGILNGDHGQTTRKLHWKATILANSSSHDLDTNSGEWEVKSETG